MLNLGKQLTNPYGAELISLLHMAKELYASPRIPCPPVEQVNMSALLLLAIKNQMAYYFAKKLATTNVEKLNRNTLTIIKNIIDVHETKFTRMQYALQILDHRLVNYMVIKTYYGFPREATDIDIFTHDFNKAVKTFLENKFNPIAFTGQKALFLVQGTKIHLHRTVTWADEKSTFIDNELIWTNPRIVMFDRVEIKIPNVHAEFLLHLAHINFECFNINLPSILYLYRQADKVDWSILLKQARKHRWEKTLRYSIKLLDVLHHTFYSKDCPFAEWNLEHRGIDNLNQLFFPMPLPRKTMLFAMTEKGLIKWAISNRTLRSINMLLFKVKQNEEAINNI